MIWIGYQDIKSLVRGVANEFPSHQGPVPGPLSFGSVGGMDRSKSFPAPDKLLEGFSLLIIIKTLIV